MDKHTVLMCCNAYPPNFIGGAELIAHSHSKELVKKGHQVIVLAGDTYSDKPMYTCYEEEFDGILVYRIRLGEENFSSSYVNFKNRVVDDMFVSILNKHRPDIVHCHNIIGLSLGLIDIAKDRGLKVMVTLHDHWGFCFKSTILRTEEKLCEDFFACSDCMMNLTGGGIDIPIKARQDYIQHILFKADAYISPSAYLADKYVKAGFPQKKIHILWNGIDVEKFSGVTKTTSTRMRFTYVGYFGQHKGVVTMLEALRLMKHRERVQIQLVGGGEQTALYHKFVAQHGLKEQVNFWGRIPNGEIERVYAQTDVYFIASVCPENQPVSITEALSSGIPVIASRLGGNIELVEDGKTGLLFQAGDAADLAAKVDFLVEHPELVREYGINARRFISEFSFSRQTDRLLELYENVPSRQDGEGESGRLRIAFTQQHFPSNAVAVLPADAELFALDWLETWDWDKIDILVIMEHEPISSRVLQGFISRGVVCIVPESDSALKQLVLKHQCGLYYEKEADLFAYLDFLIRHHQLRNILGSRARSCESAG